MCQSPGVVTTVSCSLSPYSSLSSLLSRYQFISSDLASLARFSAVVYQDVVRRGPECRQSTRSPRRRRLPACLPFSIEMLWRHQTWRHQLHLATGINNSSPHYCRYRLYFNPSCIMTEPEQAMGLWVSGSNGSLFWMGHMGQQPIQNSDPFDPLTNDP